ncbi:MAG: FG-GAP-like repeat-containing protein, partial [Balneolaceae bacterium]
FTLLMILAAGCRSDQEDLRSDSEMYAEAVSSFYLSLGAIETDQALFAFNKMNEVANLYPGEPAAWANLGVYAMRQGNFELAADRLGQARKLAPENADILFLLALLENNRGNLEESISLLREASQADPDNNRIRYLLSKQLERQDDVAHADEIQQILEGMLSSDPENQVLILELIRISTKTGNSEDIHKYTGLLSDHTTGWTSGAREQYGIVLETLEDRDFSGLAIELALLRNELNTISEFRADVNKLELPPNQVGFLITEFLTLPQPQMRAAIPDTAMTFSIERPEKFDVQTIQMIKSVTLLEDVPPLLVTIEDGIVNVDNEAELPFPGRANDRKYAESFTEIDFNYNFRNDLAFAGSRGFRLYRQDDNFTFTDVTNDIGLSDDVINRPYQKIWAADIDLDGDLDLILSPESGEPVVLRNNGDNSFTEIKLFSGVHSPVEFHWADLDSDGVPDAVFLDTEGEIHFFENLRSGNKEKIENLPISDDIAAIAYGDITADSYFDLIVLRTNGSVHRVYSRPYFTGWRSELVFEEAIHDPNLFPQESYLYIQDMDNNGRLDIIISTDSETVILLGDDNGDFKKLPVELPGLVTSVVDIDGNERLDLIGIDLEMQPFQLLNSGTMNYNARSIRARASGTEGDRRINSFGIGGEMEVRSGLLYQKQPIRSSIVHFGLGHHEETEMLRIIWPNGSVQAEFAELGIGSTIFNEQILKGSCPWLFAHNGKEHVFVTDLLWRSPLGLRINAQETAGVIQTEDRIRIPGEMMVPVNGVYDLRITAELWETHFFDRIEVVAVDHPEDTELYIDERFAFPPPDLSFRLTDKPQPVERVLDGQGRDVTDVIREIDQNYLHTFDKTQYQGVVEEHSIEIGIGDKAPAEGPLWLLAHGWVRPTDSSINLALSQGRDNPVPKGIRVDVSGENGEWETVYPDLGFPAGKTKTVMIDLEGVFLNNSDRRIRLTTTTETYWDAIQWAAGRPDAEFRETDLDPVKMDLVYRGYSEWIKEDEFSPELPDYNVITSTTPRWQDLIGYYTRFGDVKELLKKTDDRYVIMNAGDELQLEYEALKPPEDGFTRSFVMIADGWVKDGDYNTEFSKTVLPLPSHSRPDYDVNYERLQDDPVYQMHKQDWVDYHTRFITPELFRTALIFE